MKNCFFLLLLLWACDSPQKMSKTTVSPKKNNGTFSTIAFGSCNDQNRDQKMWAEVIATQPDLWIWLGDNIYGDTENMKVMAAKYEKQKSQPDYQRLLKLCPVIGIWDDHDYGVNDGGKEYPKREESKKLMLDFLDAPADAEARRPGRAAYSSHTYGQGDQKVKVILLDARYFRDALEKNTTSRQVYKPNMTGDVLGEAQWQWLETELSDSDAKVHIIGCGIQIIPEEHNWEKWANFPQARERFFKLLAKLQPAQPLLISGDRHIAELSKWQISETDYLVYELTASGITHSWSRKHPERNKYRVGDLIIERNFGLIKLDWSTPQPKVSIEVRGLNNATFLKEALHY